jgi:TolB protein
MKRLSIAVGFAAGLLATQPVIGKAQAQGQSSSMPLPLKVDGTHIVKSRSDRVRLRGVNTAALEWSSNGEGRILKTVEVAIRDWHVNHVRLPLAQDRWFGKATEPKDEGKAYRALVKQAVELCAAHGILPMAMLTAGMVTAIVPGAPAAPDEGAVGIFEGHQEVGEVRHPGSVVFDKDAGIYTIAGSGANMWAARDAFHYAWRRVSGIDAGGVVLAADIAFLGQGKEPHRKGCLIFRQDLDADSAYVDAALHGDGLTSLQFRDSKGDLTHEVQANVTAPKRLRLRKVGDYVRLYVDTGTGMEFSGAAVRITLREPFYVGIGVCSHNAETTETAVFSNVDLTTGGPSASGPATVYSTLETMTLASTDRRVVFTTDKRIEAPNWLRDGQTLIYNSEGRIYQISATGGQRRAIDTGFATRCNNDHGLSPDGKLLAISDQSQGRHQSLIYTLPVTGGRPTLVTPTGPSYWHGWSPDGRTLAYCAERDGEFDIHTIPVEGGTETRLTTAKGLDDGPEYSPDGRFIFFNSVRTGTMQIWRMKTDGTEQEPMTADEFNNWFPHPSPDGRSFVFLSYEKGVTGHPPNKDVTLRRMTLADRKVDVLARFYGGQGTINVPCWSPDGRRIAFVTYQPIP